MTYDSITSELAFFLGAFWKAFETAESTGDFTHVALMCVENVVFQLPAEEPYETLDGLVDAWWTPPPSYRITFDNAELVSADRRAIQRGVASDSFSTEDAEVRGHRCNYLAVFSDQGSIWKLTHFISNMIE